MLSHIYLLKKIASTINFLFIQIWLSKYNYQ